MNEEKKARGRKWLPVLIAGLVIVLVYVFWPEERGRAFRRAVFAGDLSKVKRWAEKWPELVNATNSTPQKIKAAPLTGGQSVSGMDRLVVDIFEEMTQVRLRRSNSSSQLPDPFQAAESAGLPPLHLALLGQDQEMIRVLLDLGADVQAVSASRMTALHMATMRDHGAEILSLLLAKGAASDATNLHSMTPLYFSVLNGNERSARMLLEAGANPHIVNREGGSLLHLAVLRPNPRIIPLLLRQGVNAAQTNLNGQTALDVARQRNLTNAIRLLATADGTKP
ncbi:MAG: ankyrin repeat domain-containing protein [Verrucomicrobiota bacterium]